MTTFVDCTVLVDGVRAADGSAGDDFLGPVILDNLSVTWGRSDTMSQPEPDSCSFEVMDQLGGDDFLSTFQTGRRVDVVAHGDTYPDPSVPTFTNPGFESATITWSPTGGTATRTTARFATGANSLCLTPQTAGVPASVVLAPAAFQPAGTNPDAWDAIPTTSPGQTWSSTAAVWLPPGASATFRAVLFTGPYVSAGSPAGTAQTVVGDGTWQTVTADSQVQVADRWVGLQVTLDPTGRSWDDLPPALAWNAVDPAWTWDDQGSLYLDDVQVTSPSTGTGRGVLVFAGRITDLSSSWDDSTGSPVVQVTATGFTADLQNRMVGDEPWPVESVAVRANRILDLSGLPVDIDIDTSIDATLLSWRDVDSQGATGLLQSIATSVDGVLWPAVHQTVGAYLRLEDPALRVSLLQLDEDTSGVPAAVLRRNLVTNPSFETASTGWAPGGAVTLSRPTTGGREGSAFLRCTATAAGSVFGTLFGAFLTMTPGEPYHLSSWVRGVVGRTMNLRMRWNNGVASTVAAPVTLTGAWQRVTLTGVVPGLATQGVPDVLQLAAGSLAGDVLDVDGVLLLRGTSNPAEPYFDGSTSDTASRDYAWTGAANASASTESTVATPNKIVIVQGDPDIGFDLSACTILRNAVTWVQDVSDVVTRVAVGWLVQGVDDEGQPTTTESTVHEVDAQLEVDFGTRRVSVSTQLQAEVDATGVAQRILARTSPTGWRAEGLAIDDEDVDGSPEGVALVLDLLDGTSRIGAPLVIGDLPSWTPAGGSVGVYLEGGTYAFTGGRWVLDLTVSAAGAGLGQSATWDDLNPSWTWNQWEPSITWNDLRGVAAGEE